MYPLFDPGFHPSTDMLHPADLLGIWSSHHQDKLGETSLSCFAYTYRSDSGLIVHPYQVSLHQGAIGRPGSIEIR